VHTLRMFTFTGGCWFTGDGFDCAAASAGNKSNKDFRNTAKLYQGLRSETRGIIGARNRLCIAVRRKTPGYSEVPDAPSLAP
jgi:hypothetical protein